MDISKAKTVLIIAFLILNMFLIYQIALEEGGGNTLLFGGREEISRLEAALEEAGLALEAPLPKGGIYLSYLIVEPWRFTPEEVIYELWRALEKEKPLPEVDIIPADSRPGQGAVYLFGGYELQVGEEGLITLKSKGTGEKEGDILGDFTAEQYLQTAQEFTGKVFFFHDFFYDYGEKKEKAVTLHFRQEYEEFPLFSGFLRLLVRENIPYGLFFYRLEPAGFTEHKREIIPPSTALLRFMESYAHESEKRKIVDFSLGFYSKHYDAERWEIPPVWRIRLDNGEIYYINAFYGILEQ